MEKTNASSTITAINKTKKPLVIPPWRCIVGDIISFTLAPKKNKSKETRYDGEVVAREGNLVRVNYVSNGTGMTALLQVRNVRHIKKPAVRVTKLYAKFGKKPENTKGQAAKDDATSKWTSCYKMSGGAV